jgi:hypothetical protein
MARGLVGEKINGNIVLDRIFEQVNDIAEKCHGDAAYFFPTD